MDAGKRWRRRVRALMEIMVPEFPVPRISYDFVSDGKHFAIFFPNGAISTSSGHFHRDPDNPRFCYVSHPWTAYRWSLDYYAKRGIPVRVTKNPTLNVYRAVAEEFGHYLVWLRDGPSDEEDNAYWDQVRSKPSSQLTTALPRSKKWRSLFKLTSRFSKRC